MHSERAGPVTVAGVLLASLALFQLIASWGVDRLLSSRDRAMFIERVKARGNDGTEVSTWFVEEEDGLGESRTATVLEIGSVASAVRGTFVSYILIVVAALVNLVVVAVAVDASVRGLRLAGALFTGLLGLSGLVLLIARSDQIRPMLPGESKLRRPPRTMKMRRELWFMRLKSPKVMTPYLAFGFLASVLMIPVTFGLESTR